MKFDEDINKIDPEKTYIGPSPVSSYSLEKPTRLLLLKSCNNDSELLPVLYKGEKMYINKHDVLPYQQEEE